MDNSDKNKGKEKKSALTDIGKKLLKEGKFGTGKDKKKTDKDAKVKKSIEALYDQDTTLMLNTGTGRPIGSTEIIDGEVFQKSVNRQWEHLGNAEELNKAKGSSE